MIELRIELQFSVLFWYSFMSHSTSENMQLNGTVSNAVHPVVSKMFALPTLYIQRINPILCNRGLLDAFCFAALVLHPSWMCTSCLGVLLSSEQSWMVLLATYYGYLKYADSLISITLKHISQFRLCEETVYIKTDILIVNSQLILSSFP